MAGGGGGSGMSVLKGYGDIGMCEKLGKNYGGERVGWLVLGFVESGETG